MSFVRYFRKRDRELSSLTLSTSNNFYINTSIFKVNWYIKYFTLKIMNDATRPNDYAHISLSVQLCCDLLPIISPKYFRVNYLVLHWLNVSQWRSMGTKVWVNIGSGTGLLADDTNPLSEPVLINHQWCLVAFPWWRFHSNWKIFILNTSLQISNPIWQPHFKETDELMGKTITRIRELIVI